MDKDINYYLSLPYTRELIPEEDGSWFVRIKELPGCMSQGSTPEMAMAMIEDAMRGWLEVELEYGEDIPEPRDDDDFSGKFVVRVAKSIHRMISEKAEEEGISQNQWINTALALALGEKTKEGALEPGQDSMEDSWPGLNASAKELLRQVAFTSGVSPEELDERLFSGWLTQNLAAVKDSHTNGDYPCAMSELSSLIEALSPFRTRSAAISAFIDQLDFLKTIISNLHQVSKQLSEVSMVKEKIRTLLEIDGQGVKNLNKEPTENLSDTIFDIKSIQKAQIFRNE